MIAERALAEHIQSLHAGLSVFKDELAWHQAGEPFPYLMVTKVGERLGTAGTGVYDREETDEETGEVVQSKWLKWRKNLRLTVRSSALASQSAADAVEAVAQTVKALLAEHVTGKPLDLTDSVSGQEVHISRLRLVDESDQSLMLTRVPFEAQRTLDVEIVVTTVREVAREEPFTNLDFIQN